MMPLLSRIKGTLQVLLRRQEVDASLDEELQSIFELLTEEKIRRGASPQQARREAWIELEGIEQVKAQVREQRHGAGLDALCQDIRYSARSLRRNPGFTLTAAVTLAIGIGATTALFSALHAILLRDLPYTQPECLVAAVKTINGRLAGDVSRLDYYDFRELGLSFADLALVTTGASRVTISGDGHPELATIAGASWNLFRTLDVQPIDGRSWQRQEEEQNANMVIISYGLWQRHFGGASDAVGSTLQLDSWPVNVGPPTIVGVLPRGFRFLHDADVWLLIGRDSWIDTSRDAHSCYLVGRLASGASFEQAQAEVDGIAAQLAQQYPDTNAGKGLLLIELHRFMVWQTRPSLVLLATTAGLVEPTDMTSVIDDDLAGFRTVLLSLGLLSTVALLLTAVGLYGVLAFQVSQRSNELGIRAAVGASPANLISLVVRQGFVLVGIGLLLGLGGALPATRLLQQLLFRVAPFDTGTYLAAATFLALVGLLACLLPAWRATRVNLVEVLHRD